MSEAMDDKVVRNSLKRKYPNKYAHLNKTIRKLSKDSVRKLTDSQVTIHNKRKNIATYRKNRPEGRFFERKRH